MEIHVVSKKLFYIINIYMSIASDILNLFDIKLSKKDRSVLKKLIFITIVFVIFILFCYSIVGSYIAYTNFILPSLKAKADA
jgi:hypothetical protein